MDYTLIPNSNGSADLGYAKSDDLFVVVYTSLTIIKGSWWFDPTFGLTKRSRMKNTAATAALLAGDCRAALQWLLDNGEAASVAVTPEPVVGKPAWLRMVCQVTATDGRTVTYDKFIEVV